MTQAPAAAQALRINPAALRQKVAQQLDRHRNGDAYPVMVVRAEPAWPHDPAVLLPDGRPARVVPCVSPLAVWEHLAADRGDEVLVLLTDIPESVLRHGVRSRIFRQRVITVEPWDLVVDAFGAQLPDSALEREAWAGEALLDAMPPAGWPKLTTSVLTRDVALRHLAAVRLGLDRRGDGPDDLDVTTLLRWSAEPGAVEAFGLLREAERDGLGRWLVEQFGRPAKALFALIAAGHGADALPLGLVCDALWSTDSAEAVRAQGRVDQYFGNLNDDATVRGFADAAVQVVSALLTAPGPGGAAAGTRRAGPGRATAHPVQRGGQRRPQPDPAHRLHPADRPPRRRRCSPRLRDPADPRARPRRSSTSPGTGWPTLEAERVRRIRMAQRLVRWLGTAVRAAGECRRRRGPADRRVGLGRSGAPPRLGRRGRPPRAADARSGRSTTGRSSGGGTWTRRLRRPARGLGHRRPRQRRRPAHRGEPAARGSSSPLVRADRPVLLVVLDGMSAAVAVQLADELSQHWVEYDPLAGCRRGPPAGDRGRPAHADRGLPDVALRRRAAHRHQDHETQALRRRSVGQGLPDLPQGPGARVGPARRCAGGLAEAVAGTAPVVAVVINTVDDSLAHGREGDERRLAARRPRLPAEPARPGPLLRTGGRHHQRPRARAGAGRRSTSRPPDAASARHRTGPGPVGPGRGRADRSAGGRRRQPDHRAVGPRCCATAPARPATTAAPRWPR